VHDEVIVMPLAAWTDPERRPCVLTEFRQGLPLLDAVGSGKLAPGDARDALRVLLEKIRAAHGTRARSRFRSCPAMSSGGRMGRCFSWISGLLPAITAGEPPIPWARSDLAGFAASSIRCASSTAIRTPADQISVTSAPHS
jgi:hypothetical protein